MNKSLYWGIVIAVLALLVITFINKEGKYAPVISPENFSGTVNNPYFTLVSGTKFVFESVKAEGKERVEVTVLPENRMVMGVKTTVVKDQVFLNDKLIEDTKDWYAQDKEGNVWYFGEETAEYEDGKVVTTAGSWEGGVDGAQPGIIMKANPAVGDKYKQEYYRGEAEDMAEVLSVNESVTVPFGSFSGCIKTFDYTRLDAKALEHKFYCKEVGFVALEVNLEDNEVLELVSKTVEKKPGVTPQASTQTPTSTSQNKITPEKAREIALRIVPGTVTNTGIETELGVDVYVIEVNPFGSGGEKDVFIDMQTGEILRVE